MAEVSRTHGLEKTPKDGTEKTAAASQAPTITLPRGGGAIRGIGEKFGVNPVTGTSSMTVPLMTSPGRSGFSPQLTLSYDSGAGNGPFGLGWSLSLPTITRKTDKSLPQYIDAEESDVFLLSGAEDLVPILKNGESIGPHLEPDDRTVDYTQYSIQVYKPRLEGLFARIEKWTNRTNAEDTFWRSISKENVTTWYGKTEESRIFDPTDKTRVFSWLICESHDDKGNAIVYRYKEENSECVGIHAAHERNRTADTRSANRYLKRIQYGNRIPYHPQLREGDPPVPLPTEWLFEVVFDYGEHHPGDPSLDDTGTWHCRNDPFSSYRAGFEIRTYRLCQRILMFHDFSELGDAPCLVRSHDFTYLYESEPKDRRNSLFSLLVSITSNGYRRRPDGSFDNKTLPPLEFDYTKADICEELKDIDPYSLENLPIGLDGTQYQWLDLDGEGVSGILTEQGNTWYYKRNLSPLRHNLQNKNDNYTVRFAPAERVAQQPSTIDLSGGRQQFLDLAGDGQIDLVQFSPPLQGYYERTHEDTWDRFVPFETIPNLDWNNPNLKFVDVTGDGHSDILIAEDEVFLWYPGLAEKGFGLLGARVHHPWDEEKGPRLVFADGTQSIYLTDLSGDGLTDIARIRNGEVSYWPHLGYGRFGAKVTMDQSPWFDSPDQFDQKRIRLADIDGSGTTDIIYLSSDGVHIYLNQSGNSWSPARVLRQFPHSDNLSEVMPVDLLGNGTVCLVWSSPLPGDTHKPMRYIDLMGGQKPHLLINVNNNLGAETHITYTTSTEFYLADKFSKTPWITKLPFPVHVVKRVETYDHISGNRFVTRYAYHHGYFDGQEREFRGFGMVEQWDTEEYGVVDSQDSDREVTNLDETSFVPPAYSRTWFHTGAFLERGRIEESLREQEYYQGDSLAHFLEDTIIPTDLEPPLTIEEKRELCRALKGSLLRQEIYACDPNEELRGHPYSVSERNYTVKRLQPRATNRHAVFFVHPRETINYHYERNPADPRINHEIALEVDDYGNVLKSVSIGYGRRAGQGDLAEGRDSEKQTRSQITYTENQYATVDEADIGPDNHRTPLLAEARTYELTGFQPPPGRWVFHAEDYVVVEDTGGRPQLIYDREIDYKQTPPDGRVRRLIEHTRTLYRKDDLTGPLPLYRLGPRALPYESFQLAFTSSLIDHVLTRNDQNLLSELDCTTILNNNGYVQSSVTGGDDDGQWWIRSGRVHYSDNPDHSPAEELTHALDHFFLPHRFEDPFGQNTIVAYDHNKLLAAKTVDAIGNTVVAEYDYYVLQPKAIIDPNLNRTEARYDGLGMVVATAVMGKASDLSGDEVPDFIAELTETQLLDFLQNPRPVGTQLLDKATTRFVYDLDRFQRAEQPASATSIVREQHVNQTGCTLSPIQVSFTYSDGFGREIQTKIQAEPGDAPQREPSNDPDIPGRLILDAQGEPVLAHTDPRWVGTGRVVYNNKGKPVKQYEPFFSSTHLYEPEPEMNMTGVTPILFYDPLERVVATLHPNDTWEKVVFDPWRQTTWDVNDTTLIMNEEGELTSDPREDMDVGGYFEQLLGTDQDAFQAWYDQRIDGQYGNSPEQQRAERQAAQRTALHARTPTIAHLDTLGRTFLTLAHNGFDSNGDPIQYATRVDLDIEGNQRAVIDARDLVVMRYDYDMLGNRIHQDSMDAGERWMLNDAAGNPVRAWDSRGHTFRTEYDELRRPAKAYVQGADPHDPTRNIFFEEIVYGEGQQDDIFLNLRTQVYQHKDTAGIITNHEYDIKGNLEHTSRQLLKDYKTTPNWNNHPDLETESFTTITLFDALNRPITQTTPDNSVIWPTYNEANLLNAVDVNLRGEEQNGQIKWTHFVTNIDYDAKGQREAIRYGNGVITKYEYDKDTFRPIHLNTTRDDSFPAARRTVQDLSYTYDPVGNITHIRDAAQPRVFFDNACIDASADYVYDAVYRLIAASGREHKGQDLPLDWDDGPRTGNLIPGDCQMLRKYVEKYHYDAVGNIMQMIHHTGGNVDQPGSIQWNRRYQYRTDNNQLLSTSQPAEAVAPEYAATPGYRSRYTYDEHGNMTTMPHLPVMQWDFKDQLQATTQQAVTSGCKPETTYYIYGASGQRVRKVTERHAPPGYTPTRREERIYIGNFEIYRKYGPDGTATKLERETLHVMDDQQRIALVETRTLGNYGSSVQLIRYQHSNHLGSATVELDASANTVSYEEYYPYGSTSYHAVDKNMQATAKRYRYTSKERDEESGLYYHGARYYAPWLGRWTSVDSVGMSATASLWHKNGRNIFGSTTSGKRFKFGRGDPNRDRSSSHGILNTKTTSVGNHSLASMNSSTEKLAIHDFGLPNKYSYVNNNPVIWIDSNGLDKERPTHLKPPFTSIQLKVELFKTLYGLRAEYDRASSSRQIRIRTTAEKNNFLDLPQHSGDVQKAKGRFLAGMAVLRALDRGINPPKDSILWRVFRVDNGKLSAIGGARLGENSLDQLIRQYGTKIQSEHSGYSDALGSKEMWSDRLNELKKEDPVFAALAGPYDPEDIRVTEEYEKAIWGTPTEVFGVKLKENLPNPEDIQIPEELQPHMSFSR